MSEIEQPSREQLGRRVRQVWEQWARQQPSPKPSWLVPWEQLTEPEREVDRIIGVEIWGDCVVAHASAIDELQRKVKRLEEEKDELQRSFMVCPVCSYSYGAAE